MGERGGRHPQAARGVRRGPPMAPHRLRGLREAPPPEAASPHVPIPRRGLPPPRSVQGSPSLPGSPTDLFFFFFGFS